ncbi:unnamed protein product [Linum tenue]|uniref:Carbonic anhydrase n=1 Tax=Linum tenue TaxID=586396 RepID=A0AAV0I2P7_9ROSI|nr:unnamed protein product [Linum tenue]
MGTRHDPTLAPFFFSLYVVVAILVLHLGLSSADDAASVSFGYCEQNGPEKWGSLSPKYEACGSGKSQSPIDIKSKEAVENSKLEKLDGDYHSVEAILINNGHNIMIHFDDSPGELQIDGKSYKLKQLHWHTPSEHTIDGQQYPLELHMVHQADDGSFTVAAILYEDGDEDKFLKKIKDELEELAKDKCSADEEAQVPLKKLEYKMLKKSPHSYYRYTGSLTAPPCSENVIWSVLADARTVSKEQVKALTEPLAEGYRMNARPVQPLNGRKVELYKDE